MNRIDDRDWSALTLGERIRQIEVEGYLLLPYLLSPDHIAQLKAETAKLETRAVDYSVHQRGCPNIQFLGGAITELAAHPITISFLRRLFGDEVILMSYGYARSEPGHPGISLHTDGQPYGSQIFGYEGSVPVMVRVLYYLDDLTPEISPFRVVPRSHLCMHADANPYKRYESHPEEVMVPAKAGSAVLINHRVFHGNYPNSGARAREMLAIAYRPTWASPIKNVPPWDAAGLAKLPDSVRPLYADRNTRHWDFHGGNKPPSMASEAPGMNPSRWINRTNSEGDSFNRQSRLSPSLFVRLIPADLITMNNTRINSCRASTAKRSFDIIFSVLGLVVTFPLFLMIAIAIKIDSKGPVFFKHRRIGLYGVPFLMYKFRTMVASAASIGPGITYHEDTRITTLGQLLRKTKLDELPQMINVWRGEMSFVGPRPEISNYVKHYTQEQEQVLTAKPGITGPAQIEWRDEASHIHDVENIDEVYIQHIMPHKLVLDLEYVKSPISLVKDLRYILLTFRTLLS